MEIIRRIVRTDWMDDIERLREMLEVDEGEIEEACAQLLADELTEEDLDSDPCTWPDFPIIDHEEEAARRAKYPKSGESKRFKFPPVKDLSQRDVVIVLHAMGVTRKSSSTRWPLVTGHRVIGPAGERMRIHPPNRRLVAANRLDRRRFHAVSIEMSGNFEGIDGNGNWYKPHKFGAARASVSQILACRQEVIALRDELREDYGVERIYMLAPHRVSGRNKRGVPNRTLDPGSRVWSLVGEWCARHAGFPIPGPGARWAGAPIEDDWHGPYWEGGEGLQLVAA